MNLGCERIEDFPKRQNRYFASFALTHMEQVRRLRDGGLLAHDWRNAFAHNLMGGVVADLLAELIGLPEKRRSFLVDRALIHDEDKRGQKDIVKIALEAVKKVVPNVTSEQMSQIRVDLRREQERACLSDIRRVTSLDWRDFGKWGILAKILRYTDSTLGVAKFTCEQSSGPYDEQGLVEKETIVDWRKRIAGVAARNHEQNLMVGIEFYGGQPAFDRLAEITEAIEKELHGKILRRHPELAEKYPESSNLNDLLRAKLYERIINTPLRSDSSKQ